MGRDQYPGVSILLPSRDQVVDVKRNLDAILTVAAAYRGDTEILLLDRGSRDRTVDVVLDFYPQVAVLGSNGEEDLYRTLDRGARRAQLAYLLYLSLAVRIPEDLVTRLVEAFLANPPLFSLAPHCGSSVLGVERRGREPRVGVPELGTTPERKPVNTLFAPLPAALVERQKLLDLGGFGPPQPNQDPATVLGLRALDQGYPSHIDPAIVVVAQVPDSSTEPAT